MRKRIIRNGVKRAIAFVASLSLVVTSNGFGMTGGGYADAEELVKLSDEEADNLYKEVKYNRQSVHDPSIVKSDDGSYYVFGTMMSVAKTNDLMNWESIIADEADDDRKGSKLYGKSYAEAFKQNALTGPTKYYDSDGKEHTVNFGTYNINNWTSPNTIKGNQWAPDVIYNKDMKKWCMYLSLNGDNWHSAIVLLTADNKEGPYTYQAPIVFSGFQTSNNTDTRNFHNTDLECVIGTQSTLPAKYDKGGSWGTFWPHAIDPCVFYDDNGKLWMSYGSWSGGIYMVELDEKTGLRDYSVKYESDFDTKQANVTTDEYFGKKIAGGYYVSGEASYIEKIGSKYVLFMSYGFMLAETGGYEMRVFYSDNPDGPYKDTNGTSAIYDRYLLNYSVDLKTTRGQKLMGNYQWDNMEIGENTQGHNSAYYDEETGRAYLVYHTRFSSGGEGHQLRVHELFLNQDGFIVASPYEYSGSNAKITSTTSYPKEKLTGSYDIITHKYEIKCKEHGGETEIVKPVKITLNADGTVSGSMSGTWSVENGTPYATINLGGKEYKGIFAEQNITGTNASTMCFTVLDKTTGLCVWGSHEIADNIAVAKNARNIGAVIGSETYNDVILSTDSTDGVSITWSSSDSSIIDNTGKVTIPQEDVEVILTARISKGKYYYDKEYRTIVKGINTPADTESGMEALYKFEGNLDNEKNPSQKGEFKSDAAGEKPIYEYNTDMGSAGIHQYFGYEGANSRSYTKFTNPLKGKELGGATVSLWVNRLDTTVFDTLWAFLDEDNSDGIDGRVFFTPNAYLGYNGSGGWFDCNQAETVTNAISLSEWHLVTVSMGKDNFSICVDGIKRYDKNNTAAWGSIDGTLYDSFGTKTLELISSAQDFYLGYGSFWGSAPYALTYL
ncbi:MAG: family 43 glycosylhydrolase [Lachnospiraceae bacterium]|nr:family 43 glycosylhydrolase [Lachnospiraceae bacterium]